MRVYLNGKEIVIFRGAVLRDLVLAHSKRSFKLLQNGYLGIYDRFGFLTEPDGPVVEGRHFFLKVKSKQK